MFFVKGKGQKGEAREVSASGSPPAIAFTPAWNLLGS